MTQPGVLERIAAALETIANALTGQPAATRAPRHPAADARFEWEPDTDQPTAAPLPEPTPPEERCGFLIEQYIHPLDRSTLIYQISKSGASVLLTRQEATELAALGDEQFTATMAARLAEVLAQRHREGRAAPESAATPAADEGNAEDEDEDEDERRQREWGATIRREDAPA